MSPNPHRELGAKRNALIDAILQDEPGIPHRTAGALLFRARPDLFSSVDTARNAVRTRTGCHGKDNRAKTEATHGHTYRQPFTGEALPVPTPFWDSTPVAFETQRCLIMGDIHIPFHEPEAIKLAVSYAKKAGCRDVLLGGDVLDHYQESDFCRIPDAATLTQELRDGRQFFTWLRRQFPNGRIVYKEGNHEERWAVRVHKCMPEVGRLLDNFTSKEIGLESLGIETVGDRRRVDIGHMTVIHGHELGRGTAILVNAARTMQLRAKECSATLHWHTPSQHRVRTIRQKHIGTGRTGLRKDDGTEQTPKGVRGHAPAQRRLLRRRDAGRVRTLGRDDA